MAFFPQMKKLKNRNMKKLLVYCCVILKWCPSTVLHFVTQDLQTNPSFSGREDLSANPQLQKEIAIICPP